MSKFCPVCGTENEDQTRFCTNCGQQFAAVSTNQTPVINQPVVTPPVGNPTPSGGKGPLIAIIASITALLAVAGTIAWFALSDKDKDDDDDKPSVSQSQEKDSSSDKKNDDSSDKDDSSELDDNSKPDDDSSKPDDDSNEEPTTTTSGSELELIPPAVDSSEDDSGSDAVNTSIVQDFMDAIADEDAEELCRIIYFKPIASYIQYYFPEDYEEAMKDMTSQFTSIVSDGEAALGDNLTLICDIKDTKKLSDLEIQTIEDTYKLIGDGLGVYDDMDISDGYTVSFEMTASGSISSKTNDAELNVFEVDGEWYIDVNSLN